MGRPTELLLLGTEPVGELEGSGIAGLLPEEVLTPSVFVLVGLPGLPAGDDGLLLPDEAADDDGSGVELVGEEGPAAPEEVLTPSVFVLVGLPGLPAGEEGPLDEAVTEDPVAEDAATEDAVTEEVLMPSVFVLVGLPGLPAGLEGA